MELILIFTTRDAGPNCTQPIMYRCFAMNNEIKHLRPILIAAGPTKYCGQDLKTRGPSGSTDERRLPSRNCSGAMMYEKGAVRRVLVRKGLSSETEVLEVKAVRREMEGRRGDEVPHGTH